MCLVSTAQEAGYWIASMWPRSEERGNLYCKDCCCGPMTLLQCGRAPRSAEICCATAQAPSLYCFNVAALRGARKLILSSSSFSFVFASMWPRSEERGNAGQPQVEISVGGLQCGRAPRSAEISPASVLPWPRPSGFNVAALRGARKLEENGDGNLAGSASMWPRSEERGNDQAYLAAVAKLEKLQCGRAPRSAEIRRAASTGFQWHRLQCGRAPRSAEMKYSPDWMMHRDEASMWPRSEERGNVGGNADRKGTRVFASMWPRSEERGNDVVPTARVDDAGRASMWPRSEERGNSAKSRIFPSCSR